MDIEAFVLSSRSGAYKPSAQPIQAKDGSGLPWPPPRCVVLVWLRIFGFNP